MMQSSIPEINQKNAGSSLENFQKVNYLRPIMPEGAPLTFYAWISYDHPSTFLNAIRTGAWAKLG